MILVDGLLIVHVAFPVKPAHVAIVEPVNIGRLSVLCGAELIVVCTRLRADRIGTLCGMRARGVTAGAGHRVAVFLPVVAALAAAHVADDSAVRVCAVAAMWALIVTVGADAPVIERGVRAGIAAAIAGVIGIKVVIFVVIEIVLLLGNVGERLAADSTLRIIAKGTVYRMIGTVDVFLSDRTLDQERIGCRDLIGVRADIAAIDALVVVPRVVGAFIAALGAFPVAVQRVILLSFFDNGFPYSVRECSLAIRAHNDILAP